jgi:hypothetical protein
MRNIYLNSSDKKFYVVDNSYHWEMPNLIFTSDEQVALAEVIIKGFGLVEVLPIKLKTTLINNDYLNPEGVMFSHVILKYGINYTASNLIFWNIEYQRPRVLIFTLEGMSVEDISFISLTLTVKQNASRTLVSYLFLFCIFKLRFFISKTRFIPKKLLGRGKKKTGKKRKKHKTGHGRRKVWLIISVFLFRILENFVVFLDHLFCAIISHITA